MEFQSKAVQMKENVSKVIVGKGNVTDLILTALIAGGHVLLEDVPGTGKTLIAKTLAKSVDAQFSRIQFTPDLVPSDVTGIHYYNQKSGEFVLRKGPVFANIVLADEINRATPANRAKGKEKVPRFSMKQTDYGIGTINSILLTPTKLKPINLVIGRAETAGFTPP